MERAKKIWLVVHCVLNSNAKIKPLAKVRGAYKDVIEKLLDEDCAVFQLPCPELGYLGAKRFGMTKEQYDTPNYRAYCQDLLKHPLVQLQNLIDDGCKIVGLTGMDGSPNCGINKTCKGYCGGEIAGNLDTIKQQAENLEMVAEHGIFIEILLAELNARCFRPQLHAVDE